MALTLELAERFLAAAKAKAQQEGWGMSLAVVDPAGNLVALARMDKARWMTAGVAQSKALTAATFGRPSKDVADLAQSRSLLFSSISELVGRPLLLGVVAAQEGFQRGHLRRFGIVHDESRTQLQPSRPQPALVRCSKGDIHASAHRRTAPSAG